MVSPIEPPPRGGRRGNTARRRARTRKAARPRRGGNAWRRTRTRARRRTTTARPRRAPPRARDGTPRQGARPRGPRWRRGALALDARQERVQRVIGGWRRCRGRGGRGVVVDGDGGEGGATRVERRTSRGGWGAERTRATGGTSTDAVADARGRAGAREREERRRRHPRARDDVRRPERGPVRRAEPRARWFCPRTRVDLVCGRLDDASSRRYRHRASRHAVVSLRVPCDDSRDVVEPRRVHGRHTRARAASSSRPVPSSRCASPSRARLGGSSGGRPALARRAFASSPATLLTILRAFLVLFAPLPRAGAYSSHPGSCDARSGHGALDSGDGGYTLTRASGALHPGERVVLTLSKPLGGADFVRICHQRLRRNPRAQVDERRRRPGVQLRQLRRTLQRLPKIDRGGVPHPPVRGRRRRSQSARRRVQDDGARDHPPPRRSLVVFVERSPVPARVFGLVPRLPMRRRARAVREPPLDPGGAAEAEDEPEADAAPESSSARTGILLRSLRRRRVRARDDGRVARVWRPSRSNPPV